MSLKNLLASAMDNQEAHSSHFAIVRAHPKQSLGLNWPGASYILISDISDIIQTELGFPVR